MTITNISSSTCLSFGCSSWVPQGVNFCDRCKKSMEERNSILTKPPVEELSKKYPQYYKSVEGFSEVDVYAIHHLFNIEDPSGAIQHASKKLLLSGCRTGGKSKYKDIKEARDTLTRWLSLNKED